MKTRFGDANDMTNADEIETLRTRFRALYVPAVSDVLDLAGYRFQVAGPELVPLDPTAVIAGPAFTILGGRPRHTALRSVGLRVIEQVTPGVVACYDTQGNRDAAAWGEFWTSSTSVRGCTGAIVDGGIRDSARMRAAGFPAFYRFRSPADAKGRMRVMDSGIAVSIGGVRVEPGDWVFADFDGVVFVPADVVLDVLAQAEKLVADEGRMRLRLDAGERPQTLFDEFGHF